MVDLYFTITLNDYGQKSPIKRQKLTECIIKNWYGLTMCFLLETYIK